MLTQERLKEVLNYHLETGVFVWRVQQGRSIIGKTAGTIDDGYLKIKIDGVKYKAHRLVWLWMNGEFPKGQIDHRDLNKSNNKYGNLRLANQTQQNANRLRQPNNTSGFRGVSFFKPRNRWRAILSGKLLGTFRTKEEAAAAYQKAACEQFGEFARVA